MTTVVDLVEETRRQLHDSNRGELNRLNAAVLIGASTLSLEFPLRGVTPGSYISVGDETMYVWDTTPDTRSVTVERGVLGTTESAHSEGDITEVNTPFTRARIKQALKNEIRSWPSDLFRVKYIDVDVSDAYRSQGVDLAITEDWYSVLDVRYKLDGSVLSSYNNSWPQVTWFDIIRSAPASDFASGTGLVIREAIQASTVRVIYAAAFDVSTFNDDTDVEATVGLSPQMLDIPAFGAAWRLEYPREVRRTLTNVQGEPRLAEEVPPGAILRAGVAMKQLRDSRIREEAARLKALYPTRHS